jgi:hypothetical protein
VDPDRTVGVLVTHVQDLQDTRRQTGFARARGEAFGTERRLRGVLEHDCIAGEQGRDHAVDGDQVRVIPRRDRQHDPERLAPHEALEVGLGPGIDVGERTRRDRDHVAGALERAAHLVRRVTDRPAHLPAELLRNRVTLRLESLAETRQQRAALRKRYRSPGTLRLARGRERRVDFERARERALA